MRRESRATVCGMSRAACLRFLKDCLREDVGTGDVTSNTLISDKVRAHGVFVAREQGVVAGLPLLEPLFKMIDKRCSVRLLRRDSERVARGDVLAEICGPARAILAGERLALNFLQQLSGVATLTASFVRAIDGTDAEILDTRKTAPGLRMLQKYAVGMGGGKNHRMRLDDMVLIKDNHLEILGGGKEALTRALSACSPVRKKGIKVEVEVETVEQARVAAEMGADVVMLDNMSAKEMRAAVRQIRLQDPKRPYRTLIEASGGVTLRTAAVLARTGVDRISVGALTHSAPSLDVALETSHGALSDTARRERKAKCTPREK